MLEDAENYGLVLPFDTDNEDFARGVECGLVLSHVRYFLDNPEGVNTFQVHATNAEMMIRIAESLGLMVRATGDDGEWMTVTFEFKESDAKA